MLAATAMDLGALVRRDHDELEHALDALASALSPPELFDEFRFALMVHIAAEARVLDPLLGLETTPPHALRWVLGQVQEDHARQRAATEELERLAPGSPEWCAGLAKLRAEIIEHAVREDLICASLADHVPDEQRQRLAARFATERLLDITRAA